MNELNLRTRREFLKTSLIGGATAATIPSFLAATIQSLHAKELNSATQAATGKDGKILVVVQLAGGNDGLNTVVPVSNDFYYKARKELAIDRKEALKLTDEFGLHPSLTGLKSLYDEGSLAIVQGVGYPNPNRSHFRSTEIWATASDWNKNESYGWIGRYFDNTCAGCPAEVGVALGNVTPQAFLSKDPRGVTFSTPEQYRLLGGSFSATGDDPEDEMFRDLNAMERNGGSTIGGLGAARKPKDGESPVDFLQRTALDAQVSSDKIRAIASKYTNKATYGAGRLGQQLQLVAKLIGGGMPTQIYYVSLGGFDTHANQLSTHERLMTDLGSSLKAFQTDMAAQGNWDRVTVMTFSEFGRRVGENANGGTDHGTAAPLFLTGGGIKAGFHGAMPSLNPKDLDRGDLKFTTDFRSVYSTVIEKRLGLDSAPALGRKFPTLPIA